MQGPHNNGNKRSGPASIIIVVLLAMMIGGGLFVVYFWDKAERKETINSAEQFEEVPERLKVYYNDAWYQLRDDLETFLLIGLDKFEETKSSPEDYINNQQADFLFLMIADDTHKTISAIHINRDTMAEIPRLGIDGSTIGSYTGQLALAHTYGSGGKDSCRNTVKAVSRYLYDVPIDHFFSVTMDAVSELNDLAGGITVHVDDDFSAVDPSLEMGKYIRLHGSQALTFVRGRGNVGDQTNLSRMARQREFIFALYKQLSQKLQESDSFGRQLASKLADYSVSDLTNTELLNLSDRMKDYSFTAIYTIDGEAVKGEDFMEFYANESALQDRVIQSFFIKSKD